MKELKKSDEKRTLRVNHNLSKRGGMNIHIKNIFDNIKNGIQLKK